MPWIVIPNCNHCGECCKPPVVVENPCIELGQDRCLFYTDEVDTGTSYGHCLIYHAKRNYNKVRDRLGNKMTAQQIAWFEHNCLKWPDPIDLIVDPNDPDTEFRFELPPSCAYTVEWVP